MKHERGDIVFRLWLDSPTNEVEEERRSNSLNCVTHIAVVRGLD